MRVAQIGPFTTALEAGATAVAAGILLGSFAMGTYRLMKKRPRRELEAHVLTDGYAGGIVGAVGALLDLILRYG
jgi:hypothetical protein